MSEKILVKATRTFPGSIAGYQGNYTFTVTAQATHLEGNLHPYFSVQGEVRNSRRRDCECCGCMHKEALKAWPAIKPIIDLHLSNSDDGEPMHVEVNGWYWLAGALGGMGEEYHGGNGQQQHWKPDGEFDGHRKSTPEECLQTFADHCRISLEEARAIAEKCKAAYEESMKAFLAQTPPDNRLAFKAARVVWTSACNAMRPRWVAEAKAGMELINKLAG